MLYILLIGILALVAAATFFVLKLFRQGRYLLNSLEHIEEALPNPTAAAEGRAYLHRLLQLEPETLPPLGGWAASADFLIIVAEHVLRAKPEVAVEFGSGVSTLVINRCLQLNGRGRLLSFESNAEFADITRGRADRLGVPHDVRAVDLVDAAPLGFAGKWYRTEDLPAEIDMIVIDGPPKAIHPETRGGAGKDVFPRLTANGRIFLDDAKRPGERAVADKWRAMFPDMRFDLIGTEKGTLIGRRPA
jgi:predicted O-methyltransferase YrrM